MIVTDPRYFNKKFAHIVFAIMVFVHLSIALFLWRDHDDYIYYMEELWEPFLSGNVKATYPIGFQLFAFLYQYWYRLPKLVFVSAFLVSVYQVMVHLFNCDDFHDVTPPTKFWAVMFLLLSPLFALNLWDGFFDTTIGLLLLNVYFLYRQDARGWKRLVKEMEIFSLIICTILVKFIGIVWLVPFVLANMDQKGKPRKAKQKAILLRLAIVAGIGVVGGVVLLSRYDLQTLIRPFLDQGSRGYRTFFEVTEQTVTEKTGVPFTLKDKPFFLSMFVAFYSATGTYIFLAVLAIVYFLAWKIGVSTEAWYLLPAITFFAFFPASHNQFIMWVAPMFIIYYTRHMEDKHQTLKCFAFQAIALAVYLFVPFAQFLNVIFLIDIFQKESIPGAPLQSKRIRSSRESTTMSALVSDAS